jgi:hypothetical protein
MIIPSLLLAPVLRGASCRTPIRVDPAAISFKRALSTPAEHTTERIIAAKAAGGGDNFSRRLDESDKRGSSSCGERKMSSQASESVRARPSVIFLVQDSLGGE